MTVAGDDIILNCTRCYALEGYGIRLAPDGAHFVCRHCKARYAVAGGTLNKV
jgi:hypothetical protein